VLALACGCEYLTGMSGTWELTDAYGHTGTMTIRQIGSFASGRLEAFGYSVPFTGSVSGNTLTVNIRGAGHDVTLVATVDGDNMTGTMVDPPQGLNTTFTGRRT